MKHTFKIGGTRLSENIPETITQNPKVGLSHAEGPVKYGVLYIDHQPIGLT